MNFGKFAKTQPNTEKSVARKKKYVKYATKYGFCVSKLPKNIARDKLLWYNYFYTKAFFVKILPFLV